MREYDIQLARNVLAKQRPYFATILYSLTLVKKKDFGTFAVDYRGNLYWDPELTWDRTEIVAVLYHEISHLLFDHRARAIHREAASKTKIDQKVWNYAGDCEINDILRSEGLKFPKSAPPLMPEHFNMPTGRTTEFYYDFLIKNAKSLPVHSCGSCAHGENEPQESEGSGSLFNMEEIRRQTAKDVLKAAGTSKVPDRWVEWSKRYTISPSIWKAHLSQILRRSITYTTGYQDYTYQRPSRREHAEFILPAMRRPLPNIAVVLDISSSMYGEPSRVSLDALDSIFQHSGIAGLTLLLTNHEVVKVYKNLRTLSGQRLESGGGTNMPAGIEYARNLVPTPTNVIVLTDGETSWHGNRPTEFDTIVGIIDQDYDHMQHMKQGVPEWAKVVEIYYGDRSGSDDD